MKSAFLLLVWLSIVATRFVFGTTGPTQTPGNKCKQKCDTHAECVEVAGGNFECVCQAGFIGDGLPGRCHDLEEVVKANCRYQFLPLLYDQVTKMKTKQNASDNVVWCDEFRLLEATILNSGWQVDYLGDTLTTGHCAMLLQEDILCPDKKTVPAHKFSKNPSAQESATIQAVIQTNKDKFVALGKLYNYGELKEFAFKHKELEYLKKEPLGVLFNTQKGIPHTTRLSITSEEAKRLRTHERTLVSNQFYAEPEFSKQGSYELYHQSGWDRGHMIPPQLASFDPWTLHNSFNYAFTVPQAPKFNRVHWLQMEEALMKHLKAAFAESYGEISILSGTTSKEIKLHAAPNGSKEFSLEEGPVRTLKENIAIPNSMWTLATLAHVDLETSGIKQVETIAYIGNNYDEPTKAITLSVPFEVIKEEYGITAIKIPPNTKHIQSFITNTLPFKTRR